MEKLGIRFYLAKLQSLFYRVLKNSANITSFMWDTDHYNSDSHEILTHELLDTVVYIW